MTQSEGGRTEGGQDVSQTVAYVLAWLVSVVLIGVDIMLVREAYLMIAAWWVDRRIDSYAEQLDFSFRSGFFYMAMLVILVGAGLAAVVGLEHHFRKLAERRQLFAKGWKPLAILAGIGVIAFPVRFLV
jgi:hypothetical protein